MVEVEEPQVDEVEVGAETALETALSLAERMESAAALGRIVRLAIKHKELAKTTELKEITSRASKTTASLVSLLRLKGMLEGRLTRIEAKKEVEYGEEEEPTDVAYQAFEVGGM